MSSFKKWLREWIKHGSERTVILLPGYVIKFAFWPPRWFSWLVLQPIEGGIQKRKLSYSWILIIGNWELLCDQIKNAVKANINEYRLADSILGPFFAPTIISFGLINIVRRCRQTNYDEAIVLCVKEIRARIYELLAKTGDKADSDIAHDLDSPNFGYLGKRIVLLDYGSRGFRRLAEKYPTQLYFIFLNAQPNL